LNKSVSVTFHTILPNPDEKRKKIVQAIANVCEKIVVMTNHSSTILQKEYNISEHKISVISHGTHLVEWSNKKKIKKTNQLKNRLILSTFGLLGPNKSIETALHALPEIAKKNPNILYLILGKTHPGIVKHDGEVYREFLEKKVKELGLEKNVQFVNKYLDLPELLEYLRLTDIYLFTSKDPNQAVSGTFAYAMSSACPVITTPIPHAQEMLLGNSGIVIDFQNSTQLSDAVIQLIENEELRKIMGKNALHKTRSTIWENSSINHAKLFNKYLDNETDLIYSLPKINHKHIHTLTTDRGMVQFSDICNPDINSGYTLDDNARAMIAICKQYELTKEVKDLKLVNTYLTFIEYCQQPNGAFLNYVDKDGVFHNQNHTSNLEDSNGRAIWSLGVLIAHQDILPLPLVKKATEIFNKSLPVVLKMESPRAIAFIIKGLYFYNKHTNNNQIQNNIDHLAAKLLDKYNSTSDGEWNWYEVYLTYANSVLPEAMLYAYLSTGKTSYKVVAKASFEFLLSHKFTDKSIKVVSNNGWHHKDIVPKKFGEQPIEISYTIQALEIFYQTFKDKSYLKKIETAISWFLGNNHLNQIIYNPLTGGCYDGLEEHNVNLNQGAESTVCYLTARLVVEKIKQNLTVKKVTRFKQKKELIYSTRWALNESKKHRSNPATIYQ
jgi:hypothetical protein